MGSYRFSMCRANSRLKEYLENRILKIKNPAFKPGEQKLKWTGRKVDLVELIYAFKALGVFNHGQVSIRHLAIQSGDTFQQDLAQFYRTFQEIKIRKTGRTNFLDRMRKHLKKWMDNSDFNGKGESP